MDSSFQYEDLPIELKLKVLEYAFGGDVDTEPTFTSSLGSFTSSCYRMADEYFDTFYHCTIPSELTIYPDLRFRQLFVSKMFLHEALPVFAKGNIVTIQLNSYRRITTDVNEDDLFRRTLKHLLFNAHRVTITYSILARDNHLDEHRIISLLSPPRLKECNLVMEKPRFWFRRWPDLRTTIVGALTSYGFTHNSSLRSLSAEELDKIETEKHPPKGLLKLLDEKHAPTEVTWHRKALLPTLQSHGFTGYGSLQIDIVASREVSPPTQRMPISLLLLFSSSDLTILNVDISKISNRFWSHRNLSDRRRLRRWESENS